jgi:hypothetical protein
MSFNPHPISTTNEQVKYQPGLTGGLIPVSSTKKSNEKLDFDRDDFDIDLSTDSEKEHQNSIGI